MLTFLNEYYHNLEQAIEKAADPNFQTDREFLNHLITRQPVLGETEPPPIFQLKEGETLTPERYEELREKVGRAYDLMDSYHKKMQALETTCKDDPHDKMTPLARLHQDQTAIAMERLNHVAQEIEAAYKDGRSLNLDEKPSSYAAPDLGIDTSKYSRDRINEVLTLPRYNQGTAYSDPNFIAPWDPPLMTAPSSTVTGSSLSRRLGCNGTANALKEF